MLQRTPISGVGEIARVVAAATALATASSSQCLEDKLNATYPSPYADFGASIAIDGDLAVVGAPRHGPAGVESGAVFVFERSAGGWDLVQELVAPGIAPYAQYGAGVAIDGTTIVVGAPEDLGTGEFTSGGGTAHVFENAGSQWIHVAELEPNDVNVKPNFGQSVALRANVLLVGADFGNGTTTTSGSVSVFERQGLDWVLVDKFFPDDSGDTDAFGWDIDISADARRAVVGAPTHGDPWPGIGAAYVFEEQGGSWVQTAKLQASNGGWDDVFAADVALSGDRIIAGARYGSIFGVTVGIGYAFELTENGWQETQMLYPNDGFPGDEFAFALDMEGDTAVIGSFKYDGDLCAQSPICNTGAGYVFRYEDGVWVQGNVLQAPDQDWGDWLGSTVALSGDTVVLGAAYEENGAERAGSAYVFSLSEANCPDLVAAPDFLWGGTAGTQHFLLRAGAANANRLYVLLGTLSGTSPGTLIDQTIVPVNWDVYTSLILFEPFLPNFGGFWGVLDADGNAEATLSVPGPAAQTLQGFEMNHAFAVYGPVVDYASQPQPLLFTP